MLGIDSIEKGGTNDLLLQPCTETPEEAPLVAMKQSFMSVFDRHMCYPFFIKLCEHLSIAEIVALTRTCKKYADLYQYLLPVQWDVDHGLRRFVRDPYGFRSQMAKTDALIAGTFPAQFFARTSWRPFKLVIFVEHGERADTFQRYLLDKEGYDLSNMDFTLYVSGFTATAGVQELTKSGSHAETGHEDCEDGEYTAEPSITTIRLVATCGQPIERILKSCSSILIANFMSWNKAYSIFPRSTFVQYKGYNLEAKDSSSCSSLREKTWAGWNLQELMWLDEQPPNHPIRNYRRVGDGFSWTIPFDTKNVQWSKIPDYVLEYQSFKMIPLQGLVYGVLRPVAYHIGATEFVHETLRYRYLCNRDLFRFLNQHFGSAIPIEPRDTEPTARQVNHASTRGNREGSSLERTGDSEKSKPSTSRDAEFPDWYREWERLSGDGNVFPEFRRGSLEVGNS